MFCVRDKVKRLHAKAPALALVLVLGLSACARQNEAPSPQRPVAFDEGEVGKVVITPMDIGARPAPPPRGWM